MIKVAVFDTKPYDRASLEKVKGDNIEFRYFEAKLNFDTAELARGFDAVSVFVNDKCDNRVIDRLFEMNIKLIALRSAGFDNVDVKSAYKKIHVVRVPAYSPEAVAEHALAMLLCNIRHIHRAYIRTRDFNFSLSGLTGFNLSGKTVGIFGTGRIGSALAKLLSGFGVRLLGCDRNHSHPEIFEYVEADEIFKSADVISMHLPLTNENHHFLNAEAFKKMKDGVVIINTSRGALIDAEALINALKAKKVGAACLDVYEEESDIFFEDKSGVILSDDLLARLLSMPNVIVTSHQAFLTEEALNSIAQTTVDNIVSFFADGYSENEICYRCGKREDCRKNGKPMKCF